VDEIGKTREAEAEAAILFGLSRTIKDARLINN
jgi:hypothetical protein